MAGNKKGGNSHQRAISKSHRSSTQPTVASPNQQSVERTKPIWYQSTLLWGAFSLFATIVFTVVAAMTKDVRWALFGALPFASIAAWEILNYFVTSTRKRAAITGFISIGLLIGLGLLYIRLKPEPLKSEDLGTQLGRLFPAQRARMSFENIHFVRGTMNIGKVPFKAENTPWQKVQPDGSVVVTLPLGFQWAPITVEVKVKNVGELSALDIHWFGGVVLSEKLDAAEEDALFDQMKSILFITQSDMKAKEVEKLIVKGNTEPPLKDVTDVIHQKKFPYLILVGKFRDQLGQLPDAEFCGHYGDDDPLFEMDHSCVRHNN